MNSVLTLNSRLFKIKLLVFEQEMSKIQSAICVAVEFIFVLLLLLHFAFKI